MNERLKTFFDFKNHALKALVTMFFLFILNIAFWVSIGDKIPLKITDIFIFSFAILFFIYLLIIFNKNRTKGENIHLAILKNNLISLKYLAALYFAIFPIIASFYYLAKSIVENINPQSYTIQVILTISAALMGIFIGYAILHLIFYIPTKLVQKEEELKEGNKNEFMYFKEGTPEEIKMQIYNLKPENKVLSKQEQDKLMRDVKKNLKRK